MGFFRFFQSGKNDESARIAKDRLQVLIAHERTSRNGPDYLPQLKADILNVIKKYVAIDDDSLSIQLEKQQDCDVLELNITLPEAAETTESRAISPAAKRRAELRRQVKVT